jgi:hypothetical protein
MKAAKKSLSKSGIAEAIVAETEMKKGEVKKDARSGRNRDGYWRRESNVP